MTRAEPWRRLYPFESHHADAGGLRYHYVDEGAGHPVVFVHGNPTWSFYWRAQIAAVAGRHRAIAPDHIGMGLSEQPEPGQYPFTLERRIADFASLIDRLDLAEPITLVVHDWGGPIGLGWAVEHVDQVARIMVTNTAAFGLPPGKKMPAALAFARSRPVGEALLIGANAFVRSTTWIGSKASLPADVRSGYLAPHRHRAGRHSVLEFVRDIPLEPDHRSYAVLDGLDRSLSLLDATPMTIAWGMRDFVFDRVVLAEWKRRFPDATVHEFETAGHLLAEDVPGELSQVLLEFIG